MSIFVAGNYQTQKPCVRCEPAGQGNDFFTPEKIAQMLSEIPIAPAVAAEETVFNARLEACNKCDSLREQVMCSHCGCFVMFRARLVKNRCPHPAGNKWIR